MENRSVCIRKIYNISQCDRLSDPKWGIPQERELIQRYISN